MSLNRTIGLTAIAALTVASGPTPHTDKSVQTTGWGPDTHSRLVSYGETSAVFSSYGSFSEDTETSFSIGVLLTGIPRSYRYVPTARFTPENPEYLIEEFTERHPPYSFTLYPLADSGGFCYKSRVDSTGRFAVGPVRPGEYHIVVFPELPSEVMTATTFLERQTGKTSVLRVDPQDIGLRRELTEYGDTILLILENDWDAKLPRETVANFHAPRTIATFGPTLVIHTTMSELRASTETPSRSR